MTFTGWAILLASTLALVALADILMGAWSKRRLERALASSSNRPTDLTERDRWYGTLSVQGNTLYYSQFGSPIWDVTLDECHLIGERTTDRGPYRPDWFLVLCSGVPPSWREAPVFADPGIHRVLSQALGAEIRPQLTNSTQLRTAIAWPHELEGKPLLNYVRTTRHAGVLGRLKDRAFPLVQGIPTEDVEELLRSVR